MRQRPSSWTRREWLAAAAAAGLASRGRAAAPSSTVAVARCTSYDHGVPEALKTLFDQIGGIGKLVSGKTVAIKINMTGSLRARTGYRSAWFTRWTHPEVIGAAVRLIGEAGATRIRVLEGSSEDDHPLEEDFLIGGWDPNTILNAAKNVEMENTGSLGLGKEYKRLDVPGGGLIYPAFDCNHSYAECDVMVSIAKLKEHDKAGLSLSLKNMVGAPPGTIYGDSAGYDEPAARPYGARTMFHIGNRQPPEGTPKEKDEKSPRDFGYRVPRITVDIVRARPVHLAIIDGIETQTAGADAALEPDSRRKLVLVKPGVLAASLNPVCADAVAAALMGFSPTAARGAAPFENCDNTLALAEQAGIGAADLDRIEVAGTPIAKLRLPFREQR
ncbi:MAG: DUF362 domain-containing protein [Bryobacteraceae bacterium]